MSGHVFQGSRKISPRRWAFSVLVQFAEVLGLFNFPDRDCVAAPASDISGCYYITANFGSSNLLPNFNENVFDLMYEMWHLLWYSFAFQWLQMRLISFSCLLVNFISSATCYSYPLSSLYLCVWICLSFWNWIIEWFYMFRYLVSVIAPFSFNYFSFNYLFSHYFRLRVV